LLAERPIIHRLYLNYTRIAGLPSRRIGKQGKRKIRVSGYQVIRMQEIGEAGYQEIRRGPTKLIPW
jgi:hypothetical protein